MAEKHKVTIPSINGAAKPIGVPTIPSLESPTPSNPWICSYACEISEHADTVVLSWDGYTLILPKDALDDPERSDVDVVFNPPLPE